MTRAIVAAGWDAPPGAVDLREHALLPAGRVSVRWSAARWTAFAEERGVELSASWLLLPAGAAVPAAGVAGLFRGCAEADGHAGLRRAALAIDRRALRSRVLSDGDAVARRCERLRQAGRRIVFTNGVFDLLHVGHVRLLQAARALGDALVVGVNTDDSARRLKGAARPVVPQFARAEMVAAVRGVDLVVLFGEQDPRALLGVVRPAVLAKGSEYSLTGVVGRRLVESRGGRVVLVPHVEGWSATGIIRMLQGRKVTPG